MGDAVAIVHSVKLLPDIPAVTMPRALVLLVHLVHHTVVVAAGIAVVPGFLVAVGTAVVLGDVAAAIV
jgi:hypothetical protein